jgi:hypothetical protein
MAMLNVFDDIGVEMGPAEVAQGLFVVPLYSWYNHVRTPRALFIQAASP